MEGGLMRKIAWTNAAIIIALLVLAAVALLTKDEGLADTIVGAVIGAVFGAASTTVVVQQHMSGKGSTSDTDTKQEP